MSGHLSFPLRLLAAAALSASLAACVVQPQREAPRPSPHEMGVRRFDQVNGRLDAMGHSIDARVNQGRYAPPDGAALHHRLDVIRREANDIAAHHGGALSPDEQRLLNNELDDLGRAAR